MFAASGYTNSTRSFPKFRVLTTQLLYIFSLMGWVQDCEPWAEKVWPHNTPV